MDIPTKVRVPLSIEQGSVFNFRIDFNEPGRKSGNRYFVVINRNPKTDKTLVMITPTTQIEKRIEFVRKTKISEKTIVVISPKEYCAFKTESAFNCNDVFEVNMEDLIRKIEDGGSMNYPKISDPIIKKIIAGINESPIVTEEIKKLI
jgi:hypothetical protein